MSVHYNEDFKIEVAKAYMDGEKSTADIAAEYNISKTSVREWAKKYGEECQYKNTTAENTGINTAQEIRRLNQMLREKDKEIEFLKKAAAFFAKEIG